MSRADEISDLQRRVTGLETTASDAVGDLSRFLASKLDAISRYQASQLDAISKRIDVLEGHLLDAVSADTWPVPPL